MSNNNTNETIIGCNFTSIGGLFWLTNIIYVALTWHNGWATLANVFVPYGLPYDLIVKFLIPFMNK